MMLATDRNMYVVLYKADNFLLLANHKNLPKSYCHNVVVIVAIYDQYIVILVFYVVTGWFTISCFGNIVTIQLAFVWRNVGLYI